ncbi:hypothetical protein KEJ36_01775, partial [Candidatus Bathyarchaeota archaeon]|nr:hypothetical protein [Candidatus Bathyarchaeota archaeon]
MGLLLDLYRIKMKIFLGAFRASKLSLLLLFLYAIGFIPGTIGMSTLLAASIKEGMDLMVYVGPLSTIISTLLALIILSTFRGYVSFEYEQSFIFTSPITPRLFLIASLLSDLTILSPFLFPLFLMLGIIAVSLSLSLLTILSMIFCLLLFALFIQFLKASLSIFLSAYKGPGPRILTILLMAALLFPALGGLHRLPLTLSYGELPYPSTAMALVIIDFIYDRVPQTYSLILLLSYFFASLALFLFTSQKNIFQLARIVPFVSPFDTSMRVQEIKMGKNIAFFSRIGFGFTLNLRSRNLLRFLMKKELIRMVRDGSLFAVFLFYVIVLFIFSLGMGSSGDMPMEVPSFMLLLYTFITPSMLISNWRIGELNNLWMPMTTSMGLEYVLKSLLYDVTLVTIAVPTFVVGILFFLGKMDLILPLALVASNAMIGCPINLYMTIKFLGTKRRATPSLMIIYAAMLLSGLLMMPPYILFTV